MTQFFGAMNDNILKAVLIFMVINGAWVGLLGTSGSSIVTFCFTIPFIFLSGFAGQVSDRYSKRTVTWWVKSVEIPIVLVAGYGFYIQNLWVTLLALIALTCQSAFFGPAKYGMIAELVKDSDLSRANGSINMLTNLSVIIGTLLAGVVSDAYCPLPYRDPPPVTSLADANPPVTPSAIASSGDEPLTGGLGEFSWVYDVFNKRDGEEKVKALKENGFVNAKLAKSDDGDVVVVVETYKEPLGKYEEDKKKDSSVEVTQAQRDKWTLAKVNPFGDRSLPIIALVLVAVLGWLASLFLTPLPKGNQNLKFEFNPLSTYFETIKEMSKTRLLMVMMAWGYFYLLAGIALLIVPQYTAIMVTTRANASVLMGVLGVAIGLGCAVAGLVSGHKIKPSLIPLGALGLIIFFFLLAFITPPEVGMLATYSDVLFSSVALFIFCAGFSAGFYIVPLQALLQSLSPEGERGRFLGTANGVSFMFLTLASFIFMVLAPVFKGAEYKMFYVCSGLMLVGAIYFLWAFRGTGLLIGSGASGLSSTAEPTNAASVADETLSENNEATECMTEDGSLSDATAAEAGASGDADADGDTTDSKESCDS